MRPIVEHRCDDSGLFKVAGALQVPEPTQANFICFNARKQELLVLADGIGNYVCYCAKAAAATFKTELR